MEESVVESDINHNNLITDNNCGAEDDPDYQSTDGIFNAEQENDNNRSKDIFQIETEYTKKGVRRKRKKYTYSPATRKEKELEEKKKKHEVLEGCGNKCKKDCNKINRTRRIDINNQFWNMNRHDQRHFVIGCVVTSGVKRRTAGENSRRTCSNQFYLKNEEGQSICVCKTFFLTTLGYKRSNDKILETMLEKNKSVISPRRDRRLGLSPPNKKNHDIIIQHIESFKPTISHYRREHAPLRRYLPSDMSVQTLFEDFVSKNPNFCSYDLYQSILKKRNISFVKLGNEECEQCEHFNLHEHSKDNLCSDCNVCRTWQLHIKKAEQARLLYKADAEKIHPDSEVHFSVDLQKVIMLPRCDMFKSVIFTGRLVVFNESFVPLGIKNKSLKPNAVIWHEAIRGRKKEDIISAYYKFLLEQRDRKKIVLWADNCTAQNKKWAFLCFLVYIINSREIIAEEIIINYFESGHTFMSADSFHHQVEKSMKKMNKIYDFNDFKTAVSNANSSKVTVLNMELKDFFEWKDLSSKFKLKRSVHLHDIVQITAQRGKMSLSYKTDYEGPLPLNFLNAKVMKTATIPVPDRQIQCRGISRERRDGIINLIQGRNSVIPTNRLTFWENIPITADNINSDEEIDF